MNYPSVKLMLEADFQIGFQYMQDDAAAINRRSGFSEDGLADELEQFMRENTPISYDKFKSVFPMFRNARAGLKLALITSEVSEALEAVRKNMGPDDHIPGFSAEEAECADAVIRLMNYATDRKLRLAEAIVAKNEFNRTRHDHTAAGRAETHGKKF